MDEQLILTLIPFCSRISLVDDAPDPMDPTLPLTAPMTRPLSRRGAMIVRLSLLRPAAVQRPQAEGKSRALRPVITAAVKRRQLLSERAAPFSSARRRDVHGKNRRQNMFR